jgi:hypothetical protein
MRKLLIYGFTVLLPVIMVGISNYHVFPDAFWIATLMLGVTAGVSGVFSYFSGDATPKVRRYCIIADIVICAVLCVNLGGHWILSREVSAAKQGVVERHAEQDRDDARKTAEAERQIAIKKADAELAANNTKLANAEARRLARLPLAERRSVLAAATPEPTAAPTQKIIITPMSLVPPGSATAPIVPKLTPEQVRENWWWFLTGLAIAECAVSVLAGCILSGVWQWDRNHNGIPDHLEKAVSDGFARLAALAKDGQRREDFQKLLQEHLDSLGK